MPTMLEMQERVRVAAAVSESYKATVINTALERAMKRLLRDYNFPKSVRYKDFSTEMGSASYPLPAGFKRPLEAYFVNTADNTQSQALRRVNRNMLRPANPTEADYFGRHYWIMGELLRVDTPMPVSSPTLKLIFWYQSTLLDDATKAWMLEDLEDLIFSRATFLVTSELRKEELAQLFAARVAEETQSIAIYANELEWEGMEMHMHEAPTWSAERYPA